MDIDLPSAHFTINTIRTKLITTSPEVLAIAREIASYDDQTQDGVVRVPLIDAGNQVLTGLVPNIILGLRTKNVKCTWEDKRVAPSCEILPPSAYGQHLRDYQREAVERCVTKKRGILVAGTGAGKTVCASEIMRVIRCRWVFLTHRIELVHQTIAAIKKFTGEDAGGIYDNERITVTTLQTFYSRLQNGRLQDVNRFDGLILDECHIAPASTYLETICSIDAFYRIGLTGTPEGRSDARDIFVTAALGPVIYKVTPQMLVGNGTLAKPVVTMLRCHQPYRMAYHEAKIRRAHEWQKAERVLILESEQRNALLLDAIERADKPCMVFVAKIAHGKRLEDALKKRKIRVDYVHGKSFKHVRAAAIKNLGNESTDVMICSTIFDEGIDIPAVATVVLAGGGKSSIKNIQRVGRGMRLVPGKTTVDVIDIYDEGCATLNKHSDARKAALKSCGYEVVIK